MTDQIRNSWLHVKIEVTCNLLKLLLDVEGSSVAREGDEYADELLQCQTNTSYCVESSSFIEVLCIPNRIKEAPICKKTQCNTDHLWYSESMALRHLVLTQQPT